MAHSRPLAFDLFSGLGGWAEGLEAEGWDVIRVDLFDMFAETGTPKPAPCLLMLQDIRTFHGSQAKGADLIVASPPCQEFSWMAMPWSRAKQVGRALRGQDEFPESYRGSRTLADLAALFDACFRIQREASEAKGERVPMVVENVRGAIPWVGRSRWNFGSYHLWGDVPALMPMPAAKAHKFNPDGTDHPPGSNSGLKVPGFRFDGSGGSFQTASVAEGLKHGGDWFSDPSSPSRQGGMKVVAEGRKGAGAGAGAEWFDGNLCVKSSRSPARKAASAKIAKIPLTLSRWIGNYWFPK